MSSLIQVSDLWSTLTSSEMISQECFLGVHLSKLLTSFHSAEQDGYKSLKQSLKQKKCLNDFFL